jgi:hypothetical protein
VVAPEPTVEVPWMIGKVVCRYEPKGLSNASTIATQEGNARVTSLQRYVSKELTHFVGRRCKTNDEDIAFSCVSSNQDR